jgi:hypothetical protein
VEDRLGTFELDSRMANMTVGLVEFQTPWVVDGATLRSLASGARRGCEKEVELGQRIRRVKMMRLYSGHIIKNGDAIVQS